jgi:glycine/D-amino acid oxidase-like deaminating enzyme
METAPAWEDFERTPLPSLSRDITRDVCVVGLGASGLAAVTEASANGLSVVGIDAGVVAAGAAGRNGGFLLAGLAPFHHEVVDLLGRDRAAALHRLTQRELDSIVAAHPESARRTGSLRIAADDSELADCDRQLLTMRVDGLPVEPYDGPEGCGLLFPDDASVHPARRAWTEALPLARLLHEHTPALEIDATGTRVRCPEATITCGAVVVAVDGGLEHVLPELRPRVRTARAQMLATAPTDRVALPRPVYARWGYDYWQQLPDGRILLGGCRDRFVDVEWTNDTEPTPAVQAALERVLRERIGVDAPITHRWAAGMAFTDDRLPLLEEVRPGVWAAGAYSGTGNVVGVLNARAALRRAIGEPSNWADLLQR